MSAEETAAQMLRALGHPTRLAIYQHLRSAGHAGSNVGRIKAAVCIPDSTLSHHLDQLRSSGLIVDQRQERFIYYRVVPALELALGQGIDALLAALVKV